MLLLCEHYVNRAGGNGTAGIMLLLCEHYVNRAGGNITAGTAMAVLVFEGEKGRRLDSNLTYSIDDISSMVIESPLRALRRSLGRLRGL